MADSKTIYRLLLKVYPARFREEYETPMERQFLDDYGEARGAPARAMFWLRTLRDLATSIPREVLRELRQDLLYAFRVHRRSPVSTILAFSALTLAIGATTGVFSVVNALLLRSLPFRDAERLVQLDYWPREPQQDRTAFQEWRSRAPYLEDAMAYMTASPGSSSGTNLSLADASRRVHMTQTSANFFSMLGAELELGRAFAADEDIRGRGNVAVIGYALWQQLFGGDPQVLGATIRLWNYPFTVIGVARPHFDYPNQTEVWTPTVFNTRGSTFHAEVIGRLKPELTLAQANRMLEAEAQREKPKQKPKQKPRPEMAPLREVLSGPVRQASAILMGAVAFVLLIACASVAQFLLSSVTERRQELMVRAALGASRARLVQQLIAESAVLTLGAAAAGLAVAWWAARLAATAQPTALATQTYTILDWRVLGFAVGVAILTGLVFGVLPASLIGRMQPAQDLIRSQPGAHVSAVSRMRATLIASQAAIAVVLLAASLSLGRSFLKLLGEDWGFRADRVVALNVSLELTPHAGPRAGQYQRDALARLRGIPGVESAGAVSSLPLTFGGLLRAGVSLEPSLKADAVPLIYASADYFRTIGSDLIEGREFTAADRQGSERVAVVNETFAREFGGGERLVGKKMWLSYAFVRGEWGYTIVGVVRSAEAWGIRQTKVVRSGPRIFLNLEQSPAQELTFVAKVRGKPEAYLAVCRDAVQRIDRQAPVYDVKTFSQLFSDALARSRFYTTSILFFGGFALLLAVIGVYGVAAHSIAQRTQEIGVRIAVGASPLHVRRLLLRQSLLPTTAGVAVGVAGAAVLGRYLRYLMASAEPVGTWTCAAAALLLASTAAIAVWAATSRILRIDPMSALRTE